MVDEEVLTTFGAYKDRVNNIFLDVILCFICYMENRHVHVTLYRYQQD